MLMANPLPTSMAAKPKLMRHRPRSDHGRSSADRDQTLPSCQTTLRLVLKCTTEHGRRGAFYSFVTPLRLLFAQLSGNVRLTQDPGYSFATAVLNIIEARPPSH